MKPLKDRVMNDNEGVWSHQGDVNAIRTYFAHLHKECSICRIPEEKSFNTFPGNGTKKCCSS